MAYRDQARSGPLPDTSVNEPVGRRLESWKEIASYLQRSEKTVRRWEECEGLPVHRLLHEKRGTVYAYAHELEAWRKSRRPRETEARQSTESDLLGDAKGTPGAGTALQDPLAAGPLPTDGKNQGREAFLQELAHRLPQRWLTAGLLCALLVTAGWIAIRHRASVRDRSLQRTTPVQFHSLAVLPLENLSPDAEQEYFADGMTAELITELARISSIRVISRTSAMRYKGTRKPLAQIARELNVDAIVEGELLRSHDRVRLTIQLIEAANDRHIWAETYDRNLDDVLALQGNISRSIAEAIRIRLSPAELAQISPQRKVDPAAHEAYLKARFFAEKRTSSGMKKAVEFFEEALRRDPQYAESYAGLAKTYQLLGAFEIISPEETNAKVRVAADRALSLDPTLSEAYAARGLSFSMYEHDWDAAERDFQNAFRVNSNDALAHHWYGEHLVNLGQFDRAVLELQRARELDPLSLIINATLGRMYRDAGRFQESIDQCRKTLELDGEYPLAHLYLGMSHAAMGNFPIAIAEMERANKVDDGPVYASALGYAYAASGNSKKARAVIHALTHKADNTYLPSSYIAMIYGGLGEKETALAWLQRGYAERDPQLPFLLFDPFMDPLRSDLRFQRILSNFRIPS